MTAPLYAARLGLYSAGFAGNEIGSINRAIADLRAEEIGLMVPEGHESLCDTERWMIGDQIHIYIRCSCHRAHCGKREMTYRRGFCRLLLNAVRPMTSFSAG